VHGDLRGQADPEAGLEAAQPATLLLACLATAAMALLAPRRSARRPERTRPTVTEGYLLRALDGRVRVADQAVRADRSQEARMAIGPVDVIIIGFPGNKFSGAIAPALMELVEARTIRVLDLLFVMKDADGAVATITIEDLDPEVGAAFASVEVLEAGDLGPEDAEEVADDLEPNSSALLIAFENSWAAKFAQACLDADGYVIDQVRIPVDVVQSVVALD
jgi:hypothetical protein